MSDSIEFLDELPPDDRPQMQPHGRSDRLQYHMEYREQKRKKLDEIKATNGCSRCPENDPDCLDFHHIDESTKTATISRLYAGTWGWARIEEELAKCEILCANCHRKEHAARDRAARAARQ